ncbi:MAG TPA: gliding motility-associated C-terminal domain-containing protein [Marinilabiliaceae bacterium]|nr:gliding motility-associated C-terminal domain-containing protein [Marinilabiliaceae bacterium]
MDRSILRITISIFISIVAMPAMGQIISSQAITEQSTPNGDQIFIYNTIQNTPLLHVRTDTVNYEWVKHNPLDNSWSQTIQTQNSTATTLVINEPGGYGLKITKGVVELGFYRCWAFEPSISNASIEIIEQDCYTLSLRATYEPTPLVYYDPTTGDTGNVIYQAAFDWSATPAAESILNDALVNIAAPVEDTKYEVTISPFGNSSKAISSSLDYTALAVKAAFKAEELKLDVPQEVHKGLGDGGRVVVEGSAPIEIQFTDESKGHITAWEWKFTGSKITKSDRNPFHVFTAIGVKDSVMLTVKNEISECENTIDNPVVVHAFESLLEAPNTFIPNWPGGRESEFSEFRVVYRSIKKYKILIFNRWGRKVYESSNPAEGWDGTIGNSLAAPGVYFYTIEAEGYNKNEKYSLQGPIHLIRGK